MLRIFFGDGAETSGVVAARRPASSLMAIR